MKKMKITFPLKKSKILFFQKLKVGFVVNFVKIVYFHIYRNVNTKYGPVQGVLHQPADNLQPVARFLGIPFATPPLGNLRSEMKTGLGSTKHQFIRFCILEEFCLITYCVCSWEYKQTFFPLAKRIFLFSNLNPFPFKPKETKIR